MKNFLLTESGYLTKKTPYGNRFIVDTIHAENGEFVAKVLDCGRKTEFKISAKTFYRLRKLARAF